MDDPGCWQWVTREEIIQSIPVEPTLTIVVLEQAPRPPQRLGYFHPRRSRTLDPTRTATFLLQPALLSLPILERLLADPMLAAQRLHSGLVLFQDRNDLLYRMPLALHQVVPSRAADCNSSWINTRGATSQLIPTA